MCPKLLDFGIAKRLDLDEHAEMYTDGEHLQPIVRVMTPDHAEAPNKSGKI